MKQYAKLSESGHIISTCYTTVPQEGMVEITEPIGERPFEKAKYHLATKQWVEDIVPEVVEFEVRTKRQKLLLESDWTQLPNGPLSAEQQTVWAAYRQQLRDITNQPGYPTDVVWPTSP